MLFKVHHALCWKKRNKSKSYVTCKVWNVTTSIPLWHEDESSWLFGYTQCQIKQHLVSWGQVVLDWCHVLSAQRKGRCLWRQQGRKSKPPTTRHKNAAVAFHLRQTLCKKIWLVLLNGTFLSSSDQSALSWLQVRLHITCLTKEKAM